jgi:hypothetical protein
MGIKYITIVHLRPSNVYPSWDFWFENKPSGNPDLIYCIRDNGISSRLNLIRRERLYFGLLFVLQQMAFLK